MISKENLEKIKKITKEFFKKTDFDPEILFNDMIDSTIPIDLKIDEPQILIGEDGRTLTEIQHLLTAILRKNIRCEKKEDIFYIDLDIQDYKKKKNEYLKDLARSIADEVSLSKKEKILPPMTAYERRIVHLELQARGDVETESIGERENRRIVIKNRA
jgi:spoIIIJ-associated protein